MVRQMLTRSALPALVALFIGAAAAFGQAPTPPGPKPKEVTLAEALKILDTAKKTAAGLNLNVSIAVTDARGDVIAVARMPGAAPTTTDDAIGTAMTSAIYGLSSGLSLARATNAATLALNAASGGRLRVVQGAVSILRNGYAIGAIGAAGATPQQNEDIAKSGLAAIQ